MSWLNPKWLKNNGPIEAGTDAAVAGPFSDNSGEEITARTMRNFAYELSQVFDAWQQLTEGPVGPAGPTNQVVIGDGVNGAYLHMYYAATPATPFVSVIPGDNPVGWTDAGDVSSVGLIVVGNVTTAATTSVQITPAAVWASANPTAPPLPNGTDLVVDFAFPQATGWVVGDPLTETALNGTLLVDSTTGEIYEREGGVWILTSLVLPAGPPGPSSHPGLSNRDTADSHPASAISLLDTAGEFASSNLEDALTEVVTSIDVRRVVKMTQAAYLLLATPDPTTLYMLTTS